MQLRIENGKLKITGSFLWFISKFTLNPMWIIAMLNVDRGLGKLSDKPSSIIESFFLPDKGKIVLGPRAHCTISFCGSPTFFRKYNTS